MPSKQLRHLRLNVTLEALVSYMFHHYKNIHVPSLQKHTCSITTKTLSQNYFFPAAKAVLVINFIILRHLLIKTEQILLKVSKKYGGVILFLEF